MKKLLVLILALLIACTSLVACGNNGEQGQTGGTTPQVTVDPNHNSVSQMTDSKFIANGLTDYVIVIPENATEYENMASGELFNFIYEATGVKMSVVKESETTLPTQIGRYVFIGKTEAAETLNVDFSDKTLTQDGFKIVTNNSNYYLLGGTRFGSVYAVYELLYHLIGWDAIAGDEIIFEKGDTVMFKTVTATEIPDFEYRISGNVGTYNDNTIAMRFRYLRAHSYGFMYVSNSIEDIEKTADETMLPKPYTAQEKVYNLLDEKVESLTETEMNEIILSVIPEKNLEEDLTEQEQQLVEEKLFELYGDEISKPLIDQAKAWADEKYKDDEDGLKEFINGVVTGLSDAQLNSLIRDNDSTVLSPEQINALMLKLFDEVYKAEQKEIDDRLRQIISSWLSESQIKTIISSVATGIDYEAFAQGEHDLTAEQLDEIRTKLWAELKVKCVANAKAGFVSRLYHNSTAYIPATFYNNPAFYSKDENVNRYHPEWYSTGQVVSNGGHYDKLQICYNAKGNEKERNAMLETALEVLIENVKANPYIDNVQFSMEDNTTWCNCPACQQDVETYGAASASVVKFCNDLYKMLEVRLEQENIDRKINLVFFSYLAISEAPVSRTNDGKIELVKSEEYPNGLKCIPGVYTFYAPVYMVYYENIKADVNKSWFEYLEEWAAVSDDLYCWYYGTNYNNYLIPYNNFSSMQENYQIAKEWGVNYLFDEGQHYSSTPRPSGFTYLKDYLGAKLMWNVNADVEAYTNKFFDNYFKDAAPAMMKYYNSLRMNFDYIYNETDMAGGIFEDVLKADFWQEGVLRQWLSYIDEAYQAIEHLKTTDKATYDKVAERIKIESISPRYLYLVLYMDKDTSEATMQMKRELKQDLQFWNWGEQGQGLSIDSLWSRWGV